MPDNIQLTTMKQRVTWLAGFIMTISLAANAQFSNTEQEISLPDIQFKLEQLEEQYSDAAIELDELSKKNEFLLELVKRMENSNAALSSQLDSLTIAIDENVEATNLLDKQLFERTTEFNEQITETRASTTESVTALDGKITQRTLYWIITILVVALASILAFVFLRKKVTTNHVSMSDRLTKTRQELEQEAIRLDEKLVGLLETQMRLIDEQRKAQGIGPSIEQDHSLALKVADEIVRIEKNISQMDESTRGIKQLTQAVNRIKDNFAANGYEMVEMVGKEFDEGMKVTANFRPDESLAPGQRIITRIIKPQVNYKGEMIQSAQIEVSQGE